MCPKVTKKKKKKQQKEVCSGVFNALTANKLLLTLAMRLFLCL